MPPQPVAAAVGAAPIATVCPPLSVDASVRKADTLSVHLAMLPAHEREEELGRIKALNPAFERVLEWLGWVVERQQ